jgi:hypothetical protein
MTEGMWASNITRSSGFVLDLAAFHPARTRFPNTR